MSWGKIHTFKLSFQINVKISLMRNSKKYRDNHYENSVGGYVWANPPNYKARCNQSQRRRKCVFSRHIIFTSAFTQAKRTSVRKHNKVHNLGEVGPINFARLASIALEAADVRRLQFAASHVKHSALSAHNTYKLQSYCIGHFTNGR
jgi:hypothetical protein